ncbi:uncharacterized protein LOC125679762 [Ostrea edulis]|uniref:uncharacterized protein LOC125679762 n=1 Tax=Ostrea edulis TaxID=37623 RepID=UPI0024AFE5C6|nr:uncharacterized protein LOC125679762 [Ostrea edulis]
MPHDSTVNVLEHLWGTGFAQNENTGCDMLTSGIQRCYATIGIKLPQENIQSIMSIANDYIKTCGINLDQFFVCYESVVLMCPNYRPINPLMISQRSLKSMMTGICENKEIYETGLECAEKKSDKFHLYMQNCYGLNHFGRAAEAQAKGNWTGFCRGLAVEFSCVEAILNAFDCGDDFLKVTNQFLHSIQPPICMDNSIGWEWVRRYGGNEGSTVHFYSSSLIISALCFLSVLKMIK